MPLAVQRRWLEATARISRPPAGTKVEQVVVGGRPAERVTADGADGGTTVLWLHGGAFWTCSPRTHRVLAAYLAAATGGAVVVPDYRLAPEHPYPAAVDDARAALRELSALGPVVLGGDSAGGALALLLAQQLRDEGADQPAALAHPRADAVQCRRALGHQVGLQVDVVPQTRQHLGGDVGAGLAERLDQRLALGAQPLIGAGLHQHRRQFVQPAVERGQLCGVTPADKGANAAADPLLTQHGIRAAVGTAHGAGAGADLHR